jgi:ribosomal protein L37AE/L43A
MDLEAKRLAAEPSSLPPVKDPDWLEEDEPKAQAHQKPACPRCRERPPTTMRLDVNGTWVPLCSACDDEIAASLKQPASPPVATPTGSMDGDEGEVTPDSPSVLTGGATPQPAPLPSVPRAETGATAPADTSSAAAPSTAGAETAPAPTTGPGASDAGPDLPPDAAAPASSPLPEQSSSPPRCAWCTATDQPMEPSRIDGLPVCVDAAACMLRVRGVEPPASEDCPSGAGAPPAPERCPETFPESKWLPAGRCVLPAGHEGPGHSLTVTAGETVDLNVRVGLQFPRGDDHADEGEGDEPPSPEDKRKRLPKGYWETNVETGEKEWRPYAAVPPPGWDPDAPLPGDEQTRAVVERALTADLPRSLRERVEALGYVLHADGTKGRMRVTEPTTGTVHRIHLNDAKPGDVEAWIREREGELRRADFLAHQGGMGGPLSAPSEEQVNVVSNVATSAVSIEALQATAKDLLARFKKAHRAKDDKGTCLLCGERIEGGDFYRGPRFGAAHEDCITEVQAGRDPKCDDLFEEGAGEEAEVSA